MNYNHGATLHRDKNDANFGPGIILPFGNFTGGHLSTPEIGREFVLRVGDVLFLNSQVITHGVTHYTGTRHSLVLFCCNNLT